jgi:hypothetical protein
VKVGLSALPSEREALLPLGASSDQLKVKSSPSGSDVPEPSRVTCVPTSTIEGLTLMSTEGG